MINATKKWIFLKISGAILVPLMLWFIINLIHIYDEKIYRCCKFFLQTQHLHFYLVFLLLMHIFFQH